MKPMIPITPQITEASPITPPTRIPKQPPLSLSPEKSKITKETSAPPTTHTIHPHQGRSEGLGISFSPLFRQFTANGTTSTVYGLKGPSGRLLHQILAISRNTVVVALGSPYLIENFPEIENYICAYAMASTSEISAVKALFGEIQNTARLPVTLPDVAPRGFSVPWPSRVTDRSAQ
jgi:hypothetical protein